MIETRNRKIYLYFFQLIYLFIYLNCSMRKQCKLVVVFEFEVSSVDFVFVHAVFLR